MRVGGERDVSNPPEQPPIARIATQVDAQRQGVDEKTDQPLELRSTPVGDRRADGKVALTGEAAEQPGKACQEHHERSRPSGIAGGMPNDLTRQAQPLGPTPIARHGRSQPVHRQLQRRHRVQLLAPVGALRFEGLVAQPAALPDGEIRILHRQLRQLERRSLLGVLTEGLVEGRQLADQDALGPAIGHDVMQAEHEEVTILVEFDQASPP